MSIGYMGMRIHHHISQVVHQTHAYKNVRMYYGATGKITDREIYEEFPAPET